MQNLLRTRHATHLLFIEFWETLEGIRKSIKEYIAVRLTQPKSEIAAVPESEPTIVDELEPAAEPKSEPIVVDESEPKPEVATIPESEATVVHEPEPAAEAEARLS